MSYGAVKLFDGMYFGDESAAADTDFVDANKISRIVNCAAGEVPNYFANPIYLDYQWKEHLCMTSFEKIITTLSAFTKLSLDNGECVLVHSLRGKNRCVALVAAYLIWTFKWTKDKSMQYIRSRRSDVAVSPSYSRELAKFELWVKLNSTVALSNDWRPLLGAQAHNYESLMVNTYINSGAADHSSRPGPIAADPSSRHAIYPTKRIRWKEQLVDPPETMVTAPYHFPKSILKTKPSPAPFISKPARRQPSPAPLAKINGLPVEDPTSRDQTTLSSSRLSVAATAIHSLGNRTGSSFSMGAFSSLQRQRPQAETETAANKLQSLNSLHYRRHPSPVVRNHTVLSSSQVRTPSPSVKDFPIPTVKLNDTTGPVLVPRRTMPTGYRRSPSPIVRSVPEIPLQEKQGNTSYRFMRFNGIKGD